MNQDCWDLILAEVDPLDYQTFYALLTVCRASFLATVRVLYKDPFRQTEKNWQQQQQSSSSFGAEQIRTPFEPISDREARCSKYSDFSRDRLEWILSLCSGNTTYWQEFAKKRKWPRVKIWEWWQDKDMEEFWGGQAELDMSEDEEMDECKANDKEESKATTTITTATTTTATTIMVPTINYYDLCRRIDPEPFRINRTFGYVSDILAENHQVIHIRFHAEKLHELSLGYRLIPEIIPFINRLSSLKYLRFDTCETDEVTFEEEMLAKQMITLHQVQFPGLLERVDVNRHDQNWRVYTDLNCCLRNLGILSGGGRGVGSLGDTSEGGGVGQQLERKQPQQLQQQNRKLRIGPVSMFAIPTSDCDLSKISVGRLKTLSIADPDIHYRSKLRTGTAIQDLLMTCQVLENLQLTLCPDDGFQWAAEGWEKLEQQRRDERNRVAREEQIQVKQNQPTGKQLLLQYRNWPLYDRAPWWHQQDQRQYNTSNKDDESIDDYDASTLISSKKLMPLKHLDLTGSVHALWEAMKYFSSTLETVQFDCRPVPRMHRPPYAHSTFGLSPNLNEMVHLKSLNLTGVKVDFQDFFFNFPSLEILRVKFWVGFHQPLWNAPITLRQLHLWGAVSWYLDPTCLKDLKNLQDLELNDPRTRGPSDAPILQPDILQTVSELQNVQDWWFPKLKRLILYGIWASRFQGSLVAKSPNLEIFDLGGALPSFEKRLEVSTFQTLPLMKESKLKVLILSSWDLSLDERLAFENLFIGRSDNNGCRDNNNSDKDHRNMNIDIGAGDDSDNSSDICSIKSTTPLFPNLEEVQFRALVGVDYTRLTKEILQRPRMKQFKVEGYGDVPDPVAVGLVPSTLEDVKETKREPYRYRTGVWAEEKRKSCTFILHGKKYLLKK